MHVGVYETVTHVRGFFPTANVTVENEDWGLLIRVWEPLRHRLSFEINVMGAHVSWSVTETPYSKLSTIMTPRHTRSYLDVCLSVYDAMALQAVEAYQTFIQLVAHLQQRAEVTTPT